MAHEIFDQLFSDISEMQSRISRATKPTSHSYYVVMRDHGKLGLEAIVHPEDTRRAVVEQIKSGEYQHIVFIHHVDGLYIEDVTDELVTEAEMLARKDA